MSSQFVIDAEPRSDNGKGASRRLRRSGKVPAIIYGAGEEPAAVSLDHDRLMHNLEQESFFSQVLTIRLNGKEQGAVLRDLQRHPAKPVIMHADFQRVSADQAIHVHVPLHFINEDTCPGVKLEGGVISHNIIEIEISCLPGDLPEFIEVDLGAMHLGDALHLSDLKVPDAVTIVELTHGESHDQSVVTVHAPKAVVIEEEEGEQPEAEEGSADEES